VNAVGQLTPLIKNHTEKEVLKSFQQKGNLRQNIENNYKLSESKNGDTLILKINGKEIIVISLTFNLTDGYCDFQRIDFSCDSCTIDHLNEILTSRKIGWKKISTDIYLSKWKLQTKMEILRTSNICSTIIYRYFNKVKSEYKREYRELSF
jgi:hypothetical protein